MRIFKRTEFGRFKKLKECWRRPRGINNKIRENKKGVKPKIGYKKPERETPPLINNLEELKNIKSKEIIISSRVGKKKRKEMEKFCEEKGIKIINMKLWKEGKTEKK